MSGEQEGCFSRDIASIKQFYKVFENEDLLNVGLLLDVIEGLI